MPRSTVSSVIAHDPDLEGFPPERLREIAQGRLDNARGQLYQSLLDFAHARDISAPQQAIDQLEGRIDGLRSAIRIQRAEIRALSGGTDTRT
jgi:hypothetical protein